MNAFRVMGLPDLFTLLNVVFGFLALLVAANTWVQYSSQFAVLFILLAALADGLDGFMARRFGSSPLGANLDSLADLVSFGTAPAFFALKSLDLSPFALSAGIFFLLCGTLRLARFNISAKNDRFFEGLPIPVAGIALSVSVLLNRPTLTVMSMVFLGILMVSRFSYPKIKDIRIFSMIGLAVIVAAFLTRWQNDILYAVILSMMIIILYLGSPVVITRLKKGK
jgi:CDP-diacylglycerol--serine O-phosphatidyltransferase